MQMDYDGLVVPYPINRLLTEEERVRRLDIRVPLSTIPDDAGTVIRQTTSQLEVVDKYFGWKGAASLFVLPLLSLFVVGLVWSMSRLAGSYSTIPASERGGAVFFIFVVVFLALPFVGLLAWLLFKEMFVLSHLPVRFHRHGGWVFVQRPGRRSNVLRVRWREVYWHIRHTRNRQFGGYSWCIAGHIMDKDGKTVRETFSFGFSAGHPEELYPLWEYVRRFMEVSPDAVPPVKALLPIEGRREGFWWGAHTILFTAPGNIALTLLLLPALAPAAFMRWLCMLTNRVPTWFEDSKLESPSENFVDHPLMPERSPAYLRIFAAIAAGLLIDLALAYWWHGRR